MCVPGLLESRVCGLQAAPAVHDIQQAKRYFVGGMVQGVGYRYFAQRAARRLGVAGYVRNLADGRVEVYAIGTTEQMDALRNALRRGPRMAAVDRVEEHDAEILPQYVNVFAIEHDE